MITIICEGGWQYKGHLINEHLSPLGQLQWVKIKTKKGIIKINAKYIISIIT